MDTQQNTTNNPEQNNLDSLDMKELIHLAEVKKDPKAQICLAKKYLVGEIEGENDKEENYKKARELIQSAADQNETEAFFQLGGLYYFGHGVERNLDKGLENYGIAGSRNHYKSLHNIGG